MILNSAPVSRAIFWRLVFGCVAEPKPSTTWPGWRPPERERP